MTLINDLENSIGKNNVLSSPEDLYCYSYDAKILNDKDYLPDVVVTPECNSHVQEIMKLANKYSIPVVRNEYFRSLQTTLKVYDILGNEVATLVNENQKAGNYEVKFDASNLASGVYVYQLQSGGFFISKKMLLIK